jgi:hypothetical protein
VGGLEPNPKLAKKPEGAAPASLPSKRAMADGWVASGIQDLPAAGWLLVSRDKVRTGTTRAVSTAAGRPSDSAVLRVSCPVESLLASLLCLLNQSGDL